MTRRVLYTVFSTMIIFFYKLIIMSMKPNATPKVIQMGEMYEIQVHFCAVACYKGKLIWILKQYTVTSIMAEYSKFLSL